jgi:hypothetical protein
VSSATWFMKFYLPAETALMRYMREGRSPSRDLSSRLLARGHVKPFEFSQENCQEPAPCRNNFHIPTQISQSYSNLGLSPQSIFTFLAHMKFTFYIQWYWNLQRVVLSLFLHWIWSKTIRMSTLHTVCQVTLDFVVLAIFMIWLKAMLVKGKVVPVLN